MTNREKRQYLDALLATSSYECSRIADLERWQWCLSKVPHLLYKYRKFDKFSVDMLEKEYAFLAPAKDLDDPFDCLTFADENEGFDREALAEASARTIVNHCLILLKSSKSRPILKAIVKSYLIDKEMEDSCFASQIYEMTSICDDEKELFCQLAPYFKEQIDETFKDPQRMFFIKNEDSKKVNVGICSLTTKVDNESMWSLYGDKYGGYCIEYAIPKQDLVLHNLTPVIYTKRLKRNIYDIDADFLLNDYWRNVWDEECVAHFLCGYLERICSKSAEWAYQDEWRLIGTPNTKINLKIKNVYLGYEIKKDKEKEVLRIAKENRFGVLKMNPPDCEMGIKFSRLI